MEGQKQEQMEIQQANCFYNYTLGLNATEINLIKTAANLLKSGISRAICFSDLKVLYIDDEDNVKFEWVQPKGRQWDLNWDIEFSDHLPSYVVDDLIFCLELSFHEQRIETPQVEKTSSYLRSALPPIVLEKGNKASSIYPWLKIYSNGIIILSFQLDRTWKGINEPTFIHDIVNLFALYFDEIWIHEKIQKLDAEVILPDAMLEEFSFAGQEIGGRKTKRLINKIRNEASENLERSLKSSSASFEIHGESWILNRIAGTEGRQDWESTIDLCRSMYANAVASLVAPNKKKNHQYLKQIKLWEGRPSISLMRFQDQPDNKTDLLNKFSSSMSRILMRSAQIFNLPDLPPDLRMFNDYSFHGNRSLLLWTWLREDGSPENAWDDNLRTQGVIFENQARAEHFEYHNLRIARACATAAAPLNDEGLLSAYEVLASAESVLHKSSQSGEITDALNYLLNAAGTTNLIAACKEQARWHLDERRYKTDKKRSYIDRWLAVLFGVVGAAGLADLVALPFLKDVYPCWSEAFTGLSAFILSSAIIGSLSVAIWILNKLR